MPVLQQIEMQQQGLAAAGGHPERQLAQVVAAERLEQSFVRQCGQELVEPVQQRTRRLRQPVQVQLGEQQRQHLEIAQLERVRGACLVDALQVATEVGVVTPQVATHGVLDLCRQQ